MPSEPAFSLQGVAQGPPWTTRRRYQPTPLGHGTDRTAILRAQHILEQGCNSSEDAGWNMVADDPENESACGDDGPIRRRTVRYPGGYDLPFDPLQRPIAEPAQANRAV